MAITSASGINAAPRKQTLADNYIDFTSSATEGWAQQYLPDLMEKEAEVYGKRTIAGFLAQVGAEEASNSDRVVWSEQGRLHLAYTATNADTSANVFTIVNDVDGNSVGADHGIRVGDTVLISEASGNTIRGFVSVRTAGAATITVLPYTHADCDAAGLTDGDDFRILVYGSEFAKGQDGRSSANEPKFKSHMNKHIIMKDYYEVSGSDTAQIGWVEISGEEGQNGYLWYLKAEGDTRTRFEDNLEMAMIEGEFAKANGGVDSLLGTAAANDTAGTEGLFAAVTARGHITTGIAGTSPTDDLGSFDNILKKFDAQGAIEENMLFINRDVSLAIDDMLATQNSYGAGGTSYGVFSNSEDMALNLGFSGFRRGSYDFYKTDWKYLNDASTRGIIENDIRGIIVPAGTSTVYDQTLGKNIKRPFLHVRYRASQADDRKMKSWTTGSVGGNITSDLDAMEVHYLSERCLITQGANNFMLLTS